MIAANEPYTDQWWLQESTLFLFTSVYFDTTEVQLIKNTLKQTKFEEKTVKSTQFRLFPLASMISRSFQTACVKRGSGKHMFGLSLLRPSRQSNISFRANKDSNIPYPGRTRSVKCPTPGPTKTIQSPPHALPPPAGMTLIGALRGAVN